MLNPFDVQTPENLTTSDMADLFVKSDSDYLQVEKAGHTFISGPRGAGKSMYFRFLEPDCQCQNSERSLSEQPFYAAYIPVKETDLNLAELFRLQESRHASVVLNEHSLILHIATKLFVSLKDRAPLTQVSGDALSELVNFRNDNLRRLFARAGFNLDNKSVEEFESLQCVLIDIIDDFDEIFSTLNEYTRRIAFVEKIVPYNGPLFGFSDFLTPLIKSIMEMSFMPTGPMFLLIDDADNLNETQASILNSWVARRTTGYICFKISIQEGEYKTYKSVNGQCIDAPHDYSEFNISDKYTTRADNYLKRAEQIVARRISKIGINSSPRDFFPFDAEQEAAIQEIGKKLRENWSDQGRGNRPSDDVTRYARPNFIRSLSEGGSKSGSSYSYSGFEQLVHLSSGIVRHLLEMASLMFAEASARSDMAIVDHISPSIQNEKARYYSDKLLFDEFRKLEQEEGDDAVAMDNPKKLKNLIEALGGMFRAILISDSSERRVFSIAFSNGPGEEVSQVLKLGVKYGYFHRSTIGNKEGTGRSELYIMTRALAPSFKLDPTSFAGYKFVTNEKIKSALYKPGKLVSEVRIKGFDEVMSDSAQGVLFDG